MMNLNHKTRNTDETTNVDEVRKGMSLDPDTILHLVDLIFLCQELKDDIPS